MNSSCSSTSSTNGQRDYSDIEIDELDIPIAITTTTSASTTISNSTNPTGSAEAVAVAVAVANILSKEEILETSVIITSDTSNFSGVYYLHQQQQNFIASGGSSGGKPLSNLIVDSMDKNGFLLLGEQQKLRSINGDDSPVLIDYTMNANNAANMNMDMTATTPNHQLLNIGDSNNNNMVSSSTSSVCSASIASASSIENSNQNTLLAENNNNNNNIDQIDPIDQILIQQQQQFTYVSNRFCEAIVVSPQPNQDQQQQLPRGENQNLQINSVDHVDHTNIILSRSSESEVGQMHAAHFDSEGDQFKNERFDIIAL